MENKNKMEVYLLVEIMTKTSNLLYGYTNNKELSPSIKECAEELLENILITLTNRLVDEEKVKEEPSCSCGNILKLSNGYSNTWTPIPATGTYNGSSITVSGTSPNTFTVPNWDHSVTTTAGYVDSTSR